MESVFARRVVHPIALVACLALLTGGCASSDPGRGGGGGNVRDDRSALQGRWEQQPQENSGSQAKGQRVVKEVTGDAETVTTYDAGGKVIHAQTAKFRLARQGPVRVYTFYDRKVTSGPEQGRSRNEPRSYVYKLRGDQFDEVWGLLPGQEEREIAVIRWKRAG